jgi:hypothetical protein
LVPSWDGPGEKRECSIYVFDGGVEAKCIAGASAEGRAGETTTRPGSALLEMAINRLFWA